MKTLRTIATSLAFGLALSATAQAEVKLNAVTLAPKAADITQGFKIFIDRFNEKFDGEVEIVWRGGPEVIPAFKQAEAVKGGAIDMAFTSPSYYAGILPESSTANLSIKSFVELRDAGYYDKMAELHDAVGLKLIGEVPFSKSRFHIFLNKDIEGLAGLEGKKIRVFPTVLPWVESFGAAPLVLSMDEIYTAMERGAVDGFVRGTVGWAGQFEGVVNYYVDPGVYRAGFPILVNPAKWDGIPAELQAEITDFIMNELAPEIDETWDDYLALGDKEMAEAGFQKVELSAEEQAEVLENSYGAAWDEIIAASPEHGPVLKEMLVD